jgi:hypothetical protein
MTVQLRYVTALRSLLACLLITSLTLGGTLAPVSAAPVGSILTSTNGTIEIENLDGVPYNDWLSFNRINNSGLPTHRQVTLRIKNTAATPLVVSSITINGNDAAWFRIPAGDAAGFTVAANSAHDVLVTFQAGPDGNQRGLRRATMSINSSDVNAPVTTVELAGYNMPNLGGDDEPTLQQIVDTFGYSTNILNPNEGQSLRGSNPGAYIAVGDEVLSGRWRRADTSKPVYVRQLVALAGDKSRASVVISGNSFRNYVSDWQSFLPRKEDTPYDPGNPDNIPPPGGPAEMSFNNNGPFNITVGGYNSIHTENDYPPVDGDDRSDMHAIRFWPVRDRQGKLVPNTYLFGQDIVGSSVSNFDYQDNVYLITNVRPDTGPNPSSIAPAPGDASLVLEFDRTYTNSLGDKDDQGLGFTETQRNKLDNDSPQNGPAESYDKTRLDLVTSGRGTLTINTTNTSNLATDNTLTNGLCLPFDGRTQPFVVTTRLVGPLNNLGTRFQQAGLMFGPNQGNFLKLTVGTQSDTTSPGKPWIQFAQELDNVATQVGALVSVPSPTTIDTLDLQLTGNPTNGEVEAAYRVNGGALIKLPAKVTLTGEAFGRFFDPRSKGCVLASSRNATATNAVFDRFAITTPIVVVGGPTVNAGSDQTVPTGSVVTLSGAASDGNGALLEGTWQQVAGTQAMQLTGSGNNRTFSAPTGYGFFTFAFSATDGQGRTSVDTVNVIVGDEPINGLKINANTPFATGTTQRFTASINGGAGQVSYEWNFGDGSPVVTGGPVVDHVFNNLGTYQVSVTARNSAGAVSATKTVVAQTPVPDFHFRYDAGSNTDVTTGGVTWKRDNGLFTPTNSPAEKRDNDGPLNNPPIANTTDDIIYQSYRGKDTSEARTITYNIPINSQLGIPTSTEVVVDLRFHFAELYWGGSTSGAGPRGPGKRQFDIIVQGTTVKRQYDITFEAGVAEAAVIYPIDGVRITNGTLTFSLKATTDYAAISAFEIIRTPDPVLGNQVPTVEAGEDQAIVVGNEVVLNGIASDADGDPLTYSWLQNQTGVPLVTLEGEGQTRRFVPNAPGTYRFTFSARDNGGLISSDSVAVTVSDVQTPVNQPPTANAGSDQVVTLGSTVTITGTSSDPDGDQLNVTWVQNENGSPMVTLNGTGALRSFVPPAEGSYIFTFNATDPGGLSAADTVVINVVNDNDPVNEPPTANAGDDKSVEVGTEVVLTGSGSDPESGNLVFSWSQTSGPDVTLNGEGLIRTFTPSVPGSYVFSLLVTDEAGLSNADSVVITVIDNLAPTANAGPDQTVGVTENVTLDGRASGDPEGAALTYEWSQIGGAPVELSSTTSSQPAFVAPATAGTLTFRLTVTDNRGLTASDDVQIVVLNNPAPIASAGADQSVRAGDTVTLDGSASSDPGGETITYNWQQVAGIDVTFTGGDTPQVTFTAPNESTTIVFRLTVTDSSGLTSTDDVEVVVAGNPTPEDGFFVYLPMTIR